MTATEACDTFYHAELLPLFDGNKLKSKDWARISAAYVEFSIDAKGDIPLDNLREQFKALRDLVKEIKIKRGVKS